MENPSPPDDDPLSMPSERTMRAGGADAPDGPALGRIDQYELVRKLGGGGFGVVYLARDTVSGIEVAIKTLHPLLKHNAEEMDNLREKFALVSRLAHTNIATALVLHPVRDIGVYDEDARRELKLSPGDSVMVMRYAPGVTLSRWRRQFPGGVVPLDLALEVGRQVAAALDYAHAERIVHRDIKPGNIMVETLDGGRLRVRILDFGLAAEIRSSMSRVSTDTGDTSGTRPYMAPEQWLGKKQDGRTDQYALACVLHELLSGAPPFAGVFETGDPAIMKDAVVRDAPDPIDGLSPAANAALLRALSKSPKDRFPTCAAFVVALSSTTEHTEDTEGGDGPTTRPQSASGAARSPSAPRGGVGNAATAGSSAAAAIEADVLSRKVDLSRQIAAIPANERNDAELAPHVAEAGRQVSAAEEACRLAHFGAAATCLDRAEEALELFVRAKERKRADAERAAQEETARRQAEAERRAREEQARREAAEVLSWQKEARRRVFRRRLLRGFLALLLIECLAFAVIVLADRRRTAKSSPGVLRNAEILNPIGNMVPDPDIVPESNRRDLTSVGITPVGSAAFSEKDFSRVFADAKALDDRGKLYEEREILLDALEKAGSDFAPALERSLGVLSARIYLEPHPGPDKVEYVVKGGDSLAAIASRYGCPKELILHANGIESPTDIRPGRRLVFPDHPGFAVTVSKSENTLLLTLDGRFFKRYVVSTGPNAKTPSGTFATKDKIEHPDWWGDGGKVVPYGDPANILGTHWLALEATGETPRVAGYGIHGTWDESSLGRRTGAGCIRMSNADVRELFLLLPRNTPVTVVE